MENDGCFGNSRSDFELGGGGRDLGRMGKRSSLGVQRMHLISSLLRLPALQNQSKEALNVLVLVQRYTLKRVIGPLKTIFNGRRVRNRITQL